MRGQRGDIQDWSLGNPSSVSITFMRSMQEVSAEHNIKQQMNEYLPLKHV